MDQDRVLVDDGGAARAAHQSVRFRGRRRSGFWYVARPEPVRMPPIYCALFSPLLGYGVDPDADY